MTDFTALKDDRVCELGADCLCLKNDWDREQCALFHMPNPHVISAYSTHRKAK